jgi:hypothetical protein
MRITRKLLLLCATAIAAMALAAPNASAEPGPIHFINEDTLEPCEAVLNNCNVHIESESPTTLVRVINGVEQPITQCTDEFHARLAEDPLGSFIHEQQLTGAPGVCNLAPCTTEPEREWPIPSGAETAPNEGGMRLEFCIIGASGDVHCEINTHVIEETSPPAPAHQYEFRANGVPTGSHCTIAPGVEIEVFSHWIIENDPLEDFDDIEIIHEGV